MPDTGTAFSQHGRRHFFAYLMSQTFVLSLGLFLLSGCFSAPVYTGPQSAHFNGEYFFNRVSADKSAWDMVSVSAGLLFTAEEWPERIENQPQRVPQERVQDESISVTFINHATVLIQVAGVNILTDPIYSSRASPVQWAGPKRVRRPGVRLEDLPLIDVILISHNHYDHLDLDTLQRLQKRNLKERDSSGSSGPLILAGLGNGTLFQEQGLKNHHDLDWGEQVTYHNVEFIFSEGQHRSGRGLTDQMKTLWGGFVIRTRQGNIYFAGDTGYGPQFREAREQYGSFALSLLPIGAYEPRWFMKPLHMNPREAVQAHIDLGSQQSVGIHWGTFQLTYESVDQPLHDLEQAVQELQIPHDRFWAMEFGETRVISTQTE